MTQPAQHPVGLLLVPIAAVLWLLWAIGFGLVGTMLLSRYKTCTDCTRRFERVQVDQVVW